MTNVSSDLSVELTPEQIAEQQAAAELLAEQQAAAADAAAAILADAAKPAVAPKGLDASKIANNRTQSKRDFVEANRKVTEFFADGTVIANGVELQRYSFRIEGINYKFNVLKNSCRGLVSDSQMRGATVTFGGVYTTTGEITYANIRSLEVVKLSKLAQIGAAGVSINATADLFD